MARRKPLLKKRHNILAALSEIGESFPPSQEALKSSEEFVCSLYQLKSDITEINALQHKMFVKNPKQNQKPPLCKDSLLQHLARCNYQCAIWKSSVVAKPDLLSPESTGWTITEEGLVPTFGIQNAVPKELLELSICRYKKSKCVDNHCKCVQNGFVCTDACSCDDDGDLCTMQFYRPIKKTVNTRVMRMIPTEMRCISYTNVPDFQRIPNDAF